MIVPVMAISNLALTWQISSEETNGAHAHYREPVPSLFPFSLPPPPPLFAPATQAKFGRDREHGESHGLKTIEFWQLKVICITSERMLSSWHSPFNC